LTQVDEFYLRKSVRVWKAKLNIRETVSVSVKVIPEVKSGRFKWNCFLILKKICTARRIKLWCKLILSEKNKILVIKRKFQSNRWKVE
jgi:hypothetical protein